MALAAAVVPSRRRLRRSPHGLGGSSITVQYQDSIWMLKYRHTARQDACRSPDTPSRGCSIRATNPNGRGLGSQIDDVRRGLATKSSTPCKSLVYLVVHPSLIHIITLKYARTLHKRRPRDARTNAPPHAHTHHRRAARSHVCRHVCSNMQAHAIMLSSKRSCPNSPQMWDGAQGVARAADRGAGAARCTPCREACEGGKGGERSSEEGCCCEGGR